MTPITSRRLLITAVGALSLSAVGFLSALGVLDTTPVSEASTLPGTLPQAADLSIAKSDSADPVEAGTSFNYTLSIDNDGPDAAADVSVTDTLPASVTFVSVTSSQGLCSETGGVLTCSLGVLAGPTSTATIEIAVTAPNATGTIVNTASVTSTTADPNPANDSVTETTTLGVDLSIVKNDLNDPLLTPLVTYPMIVTNLSSATSSGVTVVDTLPTGLVLVSTGSSQGSCTGTTTITCNLGSIGPGASATVGINANVVSPTTCTPTNTATVSSNETDVNPANNSDSETTTAIGCADLSITKSDSPDPVITGSSLTYTLNVANDGVDLAETTVTDTLPSGVTFVSAVASQGTCSELSGVVTCSLGVLSPSTSTAASVTIVVTAPATSTTITNTASVTSTQIDPNPSNNTVSESTTVNAAGADLILLKTGAPNPVVLGAPITYSLSVFNDGTLPATSVTLVDTLPLNVPATTTGVGTCSQSGVTVTCDLGTIAPSTSAVVNIIITASFPGTITNSATVSAAEFDPDLSNNTDTATNTVTFAADMSIAKVGAPDPVGVGSVLSYTVTVTNNGPALAFGVTITDSLPSTVTFLSASPTCSQVGVNVTCPIGNMTSGSSATRSISVIPNLAGLVLNTVSASSATGDPNPGNNSIVVPVTVASTTVADLALTKADSPDPVLVGQALTYTLTVTNIGPGSATAVTLTDTAPVGPATTTPSQGSCGTSGVLVTCNLGTLASSNSTTVSIQILPDTTGSIFNFAFVGSGASDPNAANNSVSVTTTVTAAADLSISKTDSPDPVEVGSVLTYTIFVNNLGLSDAAGVVVTDTLPATVTFQSASPSCSHSAGTVTCNVGTLNSATAALLIVSVIPSVDGTVTNAVSVTSTTPDPNPANNSTAITTTVTPVVEADLVLTKTDSPDPVLVGGALTYTLTVSNNGPSSATSVTLTDTLPLTPVTATPSQGSCGTSVNVVTCNLGTLASSGSATVTIQIVPNATGTITNTASVSSAIADPNLANNSTSAATTVITAADLSVTKSDAPDPVEIGNSLTYTFTVANSGPETADSVTLVDPLPATVTFGSASATQGTCSLSGTTVTCGLGDLANSASATVTIVVVPTATGTTTNSVTVSSSTFDPNSGNNAATELTTVDPAPSQADLAITKNDSPDPVVENTTLTYTIAVTNAGPSTATGVSVTDNLPSGAPATTTPSQGSCSQSGAVVSCSLGSLANAGSATVTIQIAPTAASSTITNTVSVTSAVSDPNLSNNSATATTDVLADTDGDGIPDVSDADDDNDGILDDVDILPTTPSFDFSDVFVGGTTTGTITDAGDQILTVSDATSPDGVTISASAAGGAAAATVTACGGASTLTFNAGDAATVTCGSVTIVVISGTVAVTLDADDGNQATTSLDQGNSVTFEPSTFTLTTTPTNPDPVVVEIEGEGVTLTIPEGTEVTVTESEGVLEIENSPDSSGTVVVDNNGTVSEVTPGEEEQTQGAQLLDYAVLATGSKKTRIGVRGEVSGGLVGSGGRLDIRTRAEVEEILTSGEVVVGAKAQTGNITTADTVRLKRGATTGTIVENALVPVFTLPSVDADPDTTENIKRKKSDATQGPADLAPGRYGKLESAARDTIILHSGEYDFSRIKLRSSTLLQVILDTDGGGEAIPLVVRVEGNLDFGVRVRMEISGGDASDVIFLVGGDHARLRHSGTHFATFVAPNGRVIIGVRTDLTGAAWGDRVDVRHASAVTKLAYDHDLP